MTARILCRLFGHRLRTRFDTQTRWQVCDRCGLTIWKARG